MALAKRKAARRGPKWKQNRVIEELESIATSHGYKTSARKGETYTETGKEFRPDLIAKPLKGRVHRVFEVEYTVNNNTVFKSLASLLYYLSNHDGSVGALVVPAAELAFLEKCLDTEIEIIRHFNKKVKGANPKIEIALVSFEDVEADAAKVNKWEAGGRIGQPPKCRYLPRQ